MKVVLTIHHFSPNSDEPELVTTLAGNAQPVRMIDDEIAQILSINEGVAC